jgi:cytochrome b561
MKRYETSRLAAMRSWDFAWLVCVVGIACLLRDNLHAVFGVLLWIMVVVKFRQGARSSNLVHAADFGLLSRQLSRQVYALLYAVFGAGQIMHAAVFFWNRGDFGASRPAILQPQENLRDFLAYGIVALLTIRALALLYQFNARRPPTPRMSLRSLRAEAAVARRLAPEPVQNRL